MKRLNFENYLTTIKNSCGTNMFRNLYILDDQGQKIDVMENGNLSCAIFVTSILSQFKKIDGRHATVEGTIKALQKYNWQKNNNQNLEIGDIIIWDIPKDKSYNHLHIGFYIGNTLAVSNSSENGFPIAHHYTFNNSRDILETYRTNWFDEEI